jgi:hypothetical protein
MTAKVNRALVWWDVARDERLAKRAQLAANLPAIFGLPR